MIENERHLHRVLVDFLDHYHHERPIAASSCDRQTQRLKRAAAPSNAATASTASSTSTTEPPPEAEFE